MNRFATSRDFLFWAVDRDMFSCTGRRGYMQARVSLASMMLKMVVIFGLGLRQTQQYLFKTYSPFSVLHGELTLLPLEFSVPEAARKVATNCGQSTPMVN
jgi:hypothetical protein